MNKKIAIGIVLLAINLSMLSVFAQTPEDESTPVTTSEQIKADPEPNYIEAVINIDEAIEIKKSTIFDASQSFVPNPNQELHYEWDFGDGNRNEGIEVLHAYKEPGRYVVTLEIKDNQNLARTQKEVYAYKKLIFLITDVEEAKDRIDIITKNYAENHGVYLKIIESFGSSTEFISEEVLNKKLTEQLGTLQKAQQILIWTKENAGLNALSRYLRNNPINFSQKSITIFADNIEGNLIRIQRQFANIEPKHIIVTKEGSISELIDSANDEDFQKRLKEKGHEYAIVSEETGKIRPWNFMSYFVDYLVNEGIPDNTIALLLLLPVIATVVAFMKQVVGMTTFGIYTPSIITLSFLIIGIDIGLIVLLTSMVIGSLTRPALYKVRMLFIPKMAMVLTIVTLVLFLILIISNYFNFLDAAFLSIAIFPMLILSTLVEKFVSVRTEQGLSSAISLMAQTVLVAVIAYFLVGGEINLGIITFRLEFIKRIMLSYPEIIFLLLIIDILLGRWSGLRILERIRFREVLRHIEE